MKWLRASGVADPNRVAIYGRSYGGFMVLAAITTYPDLWAAAIDVGGIANWVTFLENTGPWRRAHREKEYGSLEQDRALLENISPVHKVDRIRAPLLVVHGANDPRVPVMEADRMVDSLRRRGHPVEYLRYPDEGHKISKLVNRVDSFTKMAGFFWREIFNPGASRTDLQVLHRASPLPGRLRKTRFPGFAEAKNPVFD